VLNVDIRDVEKKPRFSETQRIISVSIKLHIGLYSEPV